MPRQVATLSIPFPLAGVDVSTAFVRQPAGAPGPYGVTATAPVAHNVRAVEVGTGRVRGASRPGLLRWLSAAVDQGQVTLEPDDIANLEAWYDGNDETTVWQDSARTTPAANDGDPVGAWDDKSGNARHLTQATAGKRATYQTAEQNSLDVIRLDGSDDFLATAAFVLPQPLTIFAVARTDDLTTQRYLVESRQGAGVGVEQSLQVIGSARWAYNAGTFTASTATASSTTFHLFVAVFSGTASHLDIDGTTDTTADPGAKTRDGLTVGATQGGTSPWDGDVAEVGIYSRALDDAEIMGLTAHLLTKWGL